jgi:hypothetical protein
LPAGYAEEGHGTVPPIVFEMGSAKSGEDLDEGWDKAERVGGHIARWLKAMEGDVFIELDEVMDYRVTLEAAPLYIHFRRQSVGLYVNRKYVCEWVFPDAHTFTTFEDVIPASMLREGTNTFTLRVGYIRRIRPDPRELGVAVERITLTPVE